MDNIIIAALKAEHTNLSRKFAAIEETLAAYGATEMSHTKHAVRSRTLSEKTQKIRACIKELIDTRCEKPTPTREILAHLNGNSVNVGGKKPIATLSAFLSNSDEFTSIGRKGWVLTKYVEGSDVTASEPSKLSEDVISSVSTASFPVDARRIQADDLGKGG